MSHQKSAAIGASEEEKAKKPDCIVNREERERKRETEKERGKERKKEREKREKKEENNCRIFWHQNMKGERTTRRQFHRQ